MGRSIALLPATMATSRHRPPHSISKHDLNYIALDGTIGLETMCVGGGQGMAMVIERLS